MFGFSNEHTSEAVAQRCCVKKVVLRNFAKFTGKHLCQGLFFNKVAGRISKNTFFVEHLRTTASGHPRYESIDLKSFLYILHVYDNEISYRKLFQYNQINNSLHIFGGETIQKRFLNNFYGKQEFSTTNSWKFSKIFQNKFWTTMHHERSLFSPISDECWLNAL